MNVGAASKDDEQLMAVMAVLWLLGSMAMLGPVGLAAATITFVAAMLFGLELVGGMLIGAIGAGIGFILWRSHGWLTEPLQEMAEIYRTYLFDGFRWDTVGLFALFGDMIWHRPAWSFFGPLGIAAGRRLLDRLDAFHEKPAEAGGARQAIKEARDQHQGADQPLPRQSDSGRDRGRQPDRRRSEKRRAGPSDRQGRQASHAGAGHHRQRQDGDALEHRRKRNPA